MTQQMTLGQSSVVSLFCQVTMRQWDFTECKFCYSVWGCISWHETITHYFTPLPFIQKNYSHYDFSCWVKPEFFHGINTRDLMISAWDSSSYFLPTIWQHKCNNGCILLRVISPYGTSGGIWDIFNISVGKLKISCQSANILPASTMLTYTLQHSKNNLSFQILFGMSWRINKYGWCIRRDRAHSIQIAIILVVWTGV